MHEKRFNREIESLRDPDRIAKLEIGLVIDLVLAGLNNPTAVLDVGTGSGLFAAQFATKGMKVAGLDVNPEMIKASQVFVPSGDFQIGIAEKLPFENKTFDIVFMGLLLHEVDDLLAALSEANRVVTQRLAVLEWPYEEQSFGPPLEHRLSFKNINTAAKHAGFKNVKQLQLESLVLYLFEK